MQLQAVSNKRLYIQIADQIRGLVDAGEVAPGQQLPSERDLAEQLGVSRPTVREALIALEVAGVVEVRVGVGAFVRRDTARSVVLPSTDHSPLEIMEARMLIEPHVAALAAGNADEASIAVMQGILDQMRSETGEGRWSRESDQALHLAIVEQCGNQTLRELMLSLWKGRAEELDAQFHQHLASITSLRKRILADHEKIVQSIATNDEAAARKAMTSHLKYVQRAMVTVWD